MLGNHIWHNQYTLITNAYICDFWAIMEFGISTLNPIQSIWSVCINREWTGIVAHFIWIHLTWIAAWRRLMVYLMHIGLFKPHFPQTTPFHVKPSNHISIQSISISVMSISLYLYIYIAFIATNSFWGK